MTESQEGSLVLFVIRAGLIIGGTALAFDPGLFHGAVAVGVVAIIVGVFGL